MSVLLGTWMADPATGEHVEAEVVHVIVMARTDRRKDRVEVGYEQLAEAEELASALKNASGQDIRIIGWFHSHPHITVLPSHVDIRTQAQYQAMDAGFFGLICAVFQDDLKQQSGRVALTAFQSVPAFAAVRGGGGEGEGSSMARGLAQVENEPFLPFDAAAGEAGSGFVCKRVPISLLPVSPLSPLWAWRGETSTSYSDRACDAMRCLVSLQEVLMREERYFYECAVRANLRNNSQGGAGRGARDVSIRESSQGRIGAVHALHNAAIYSRALSSLLEESALPLANTLESVLLNLRREVRRVRRSTEGLEGDLPSERAPPTERDEEGEARGGNGGEMMDVEGPYQQASLLGGNTARKEKAGASSSPPPPSPYSASILASSRPKILRRAAEGSFMQSLLQEEGLRGEVRVSLVREYPSGGGIDGNISGFGEWALEVGKLRGRLTRLYESGGNMMSFGLAGARKGCEVQNERIVQLLGSDDLVSFWCRRVKPIVCPTATIYEQASPR